ncbi:hypothetical protein [Rhodoblastus sp.]|uniref:hypothetical protein n=1 Tax=Rhodoblastus sp. TaxID=1962975 RepID=UPI003F9461BF
MGQREGLRGLAFIIAMASSTDFAVTTFAVLRLRAAACMVADPAIPTTVTSGWSTSAMVAMFEGPAAR